MRHLSRLLVLVVLVLVAGGPILAAPSILPSALTVSAPQPSATPFARALEALGYGLVVFGAIRIKDTGSLGQKFVSRAGAATGDYQSGVQAAGPDWETNTKNAEGAYEQGVQESIAKKRFGRGVAAAGQTKYVQNATKLGPQRYQTGVANAQEAWVRGVQPALDRLKSLNLPPRGPRRSPANQQRANMVAMELGKLKDGQ